MKSYSVFETEMRVRPDDLDMNRHVHNSKYFDYVLAARYDQMENNYKMRMEEFIELGFGWVVSKAIIDYKRPLGLGDRFIVRTGIKEILKNGVIVLFEILKKDSPKICCSGDFHYIMVSNETGRSVSIPTDIIERYSI